MSLAQRCLISAPRYAAHLVVSASVPAHDATERSTADQSLAALAILVSAVALSSGPVLIHLTSKDSNPFYFNAILLGSAIVIRILFLIWTKKRYVDAFFQHSTDEQANISCEHHNIRLRHPELHLSFFKQRRSADTCKKVETTIASGKSARPSIWIRIPLLWTVISCFEFGILVWSAQFVETAIATTVYELWPALLVYGLARHEITDTLYRHRSKASGSAKTTVSSEHMVLTMLAVVGLVFMLGSQAGDSVTSLKDIFSFDATIGIVLALVAATLGTLSALGSISYGRVVYYRLVDETVSAEARDPRPIEDRGSRDRRLLLWLTILGLTIANCVSLPGVLVAIFVTSAGTREANISASGLLGAALLGSVYTAGAVLLRVGNIGAPGPGVNALFFLSPLLALAWLMVVGVSVPRFDLFVVGAALIIAINILIQLKPDKGRDFSTFGKDALPGCPARFHCVYSVHLDLRHCCVFA